MACSKVSENLELQANGLWYTLQIHFKYNILKKLCNKQINSLFYEEKLVNSLDTK